MASIIYSPKDIFDQEFKISMRGFDRAEVDEFLDNVINDYELFLAEISALKAENDRLKSENQALTAQVEELKEVSERAVKQDPEVKAPVEVPLHVVDSPAPKPTPVPVEVPVQEPVRMSVAATNFDILKRLSRLEKEVFGKQIVE